MHRHHTSPQGKLMLTTARRNPHTICWWCGSRPKPAKTVKGNLYIPWEADHIAPVVKGSPLSATCRKCNRARPGVLPDRKAIQRICHDPNVLRVVNPADRIKYGNSMSRATTEWLKAASRHYFKTERHIDIILAASPHRRIIRHNERGNPVVAQPEYELAMKSGLLPRREEGEAIIKTDGTQQT